MLHIFTDGSCLGNPGAGAWAFAYMNESECATIKNWKEAKSKTGQEVMTTNNRMEMMAVIEALKEVKSIEAKIVITTDSQYVKNGITTWLPGWKKRGWKRYDGQPVKNQDLWQELDVLATPREIIWEWVKGHSGDEANEYVNDLAQKAAREVSVLPSKKQKI